MNDVLNILIPTFMFIIGCLWMRYCFHYWVKSWAKKNSLNLTGYKICWFRRGPYWFTWFPIPGGLVYRITTSSTSGNELSGWVWLNSGFFYGGNGKVTWDEGEHPDQCVKSGFFDYRIWKPFARIMLSLPLLFILAAVCFGISRSFYLRKAIVTNATIIELIETKSDSGHTLFKPVYLFKDETGNEVNVTSSTASDPPAGEIGDLIEVLYHPDDPHNSIQNKFFDKWGMATIFAVLGIVWLVIFGSIYCLINERMKKEDEPAVGA